MATRHDQDVFAGRSRGLSTGLRSWIGEKENVLVPHVGPGEYNAQVRDDRNRLCVAASRTKRGLVLTHTIKQGRPLFARSSECSSCS